MTWRFLFLGLLFWPGLALSETVRVRSGEHAGFSRLLLDFSQPEDWRFGRVEGGYEFRPARADIDYDLRRVFDLIPRARVLDIQNREDGALFIGVDCDCHADAFALQRGQVVVDIKTGPAPEAALQFEALLDPPDDPVPPEAPLVLARRIDPQARRAGLPLLLPFGQSGPEIGALPERPDPAEPVPSAVPQPEPVVEIDNAELEMAHANETADHSTTGPDAQMPPPEKQNRVSETQTALVEQIARAAAQGLLDADMAGIEAQVEQAVDPLDRIPDEEVRAPDPLPPVTPRGHISVANSIDQAFAANGGKPRETDDGNACIDPALFDVVNWGTPLDESSSLGDYRSKIVGEFDIANGEGITDLARHYIYITFGAEAKALIGRYPTDVVRGDILTMMADIVDNGSSKNAPRFIEQMPCDSATALWATLAQPALVRGQSVNGAAIARSFSELPVHLRQHLGPDLADRLLSFGDRQTADMIRNAVARTTDTPDAPFKILEAHIDVVDGENDAAAQKLDDVIAGAGDELPEALVERAEMALEAGGALPDDMIALLGSVAFEQRGTEKEGILTDVEIRALAVSSRFEDAFDRLEAAARTGMISPERQAELQADIFNEIADKASEATFLVEVMGRIDTAVGLPGPERRRLAAVFLDLGFAPPARRVLGGEGQLPEREDRELFARAALVEDRPDIAIGYLAGLTTETAKIMRAQALEAARDHEGAVRAFGELGDDAATLRAAWRGGIWSTVAALGTEAQGDAARLMEDLPPAAEGADTPSAPSVPGDGEPLTPIANGQALLEASQSTRDTVRALLGEVSGPAPNNGL